MHILRPSRYVFSPMGFGCIMSESNVPVWPICMHTIPWLEFPPVRLVLVLPDPLARISSGNWPRMPCKHHGSGGVGPLHFQASLIGLLARDRHFS